MFLLTLLKESVRRHSRLKPYLRTVPQGVPKDASVRTECPRRLHLHVARHAHVQREGRHGGGGGGGGGAPVHFPERLGSSASLRAEGGGRVARWR